MYKIEYSKWSILLIDNFDMIPKDNGRKRRRKGAVIRHLSVKLQAYLYLFRSRWFSFPCFGSILFWKGSSAHQKVCVNKLNILFPPFKKHKLFLKLKNKKKSWKGVSFRWDNTKPKKTMDWDESEYNKVEQFLINLSSVLIKFKIMWKLATFQGGRRLRLHKND